MARHQPRDSQKFIEGALISLSCRIAGFVLKSVVLQYALPEYRRQRRPVLNRRQIGQAVKEILGEEWFDLEFDSDCRLRDWSEDDVLLPDDQMDLDSGMIFVGDGDEE